MSSPLLRILLPLFLLLIINPLKSDGQVVEQWCIADEQTLDEVLQGSLNWACGSGGADCTEIQENRSCYFPNTMKDHASYAFNSYWQIFKNQGAFCYFNGAAMVTELDPSHDSCKFQFVP